MCYNNIDVSVYYELAYMADWYPDRIDVTPIVT